MANRQNGFAGCVGRSGVGRYGVVALVVVLSVWPVVLAAFSAGVWHGKRARINETEIKARTLLEGYLAEARRKRVEQTHATPAALRPD